MTRLLCRRSIARLCGTLLFVAAGCASDDDVSDAPPETTDDSTDNSIDGGVAVDPLTGEQICVRLTSDDVSAALGLDVIEAEPDDSSTPQCTYRYRSGTGGISTLTVASIRPEDVGGAIGAEAYTTVLDVNRSVIGPDLVEEGTLEVGDDATRLSGRALHLGVLDANGHILTVAISTADADGAAVDSLLAEMAANLS